MNLVTNLFRRSQMQQEIEEELRSHREHRADDLERSGLTREEAERRARIEFGGRVRFEEECQEAAGGAGVETFVQDVRFSLRILRKTPGFTVAAIVTLALGIGANAVVFGVLNSLVLRPLNVPQAESLWGSVYGNGSDTGWQSYLNYIDLRDRNHSFDGLAAWNFEAVGLVAGGDPAPAWGYAASGNYFDVLRIHPYLGRFFHSSDEHGPGSAPLIVLGYAYWHSHFADDRGVLGRIVKLNKHPFTVIGVAPPEFHGTLLFAAPDFFIPLVNEDQVNGENVLNTRGTRAAIFETFGHLKPGVTPAQAVEDVKAVGNYLAKTYPKDFGQKHYVLARPGLTSFGEPLRAFMTGVTLLAGLILLAACANLGSLFAAHAADRSREVALRIALGSSRSRVLRQLFTEAILISLAGGAIGLWGTVNLLQKLSGWQPFPGTPVHVPVSPDARVYIVALALALLSAFLFGMIPVRQVLRTDPYQVVKAGTAGAMGLRITARDLLLGVQIAICAVLVTSSMVALRGLVRSLNANFGFEPRHAMLAGGNLGMAGYTGAQIPVMQKRMIEAVRTIPGVEHAGLVNSYPPLVFAAGTRVSVFTDRTTDLRPANAAAMPYRYDVSPEYFQTASTALIAGRDFTWHDDKNATRVAVVNRQLAARFFGSAANALDRHFKFQDATRVQIVGVVENGKYLGVTEDPQAAVFTPFLQAPSGQAYVIVRSSRDPHELAAAMREKIHELDPGLSVDIQTWNSLLQVALFPSRVATVALGVLGLMGAMLSITGIFGMAAYSVSKRLKELGIRMALGAQRKEVLEAALGRAFKLLAFGSAAGLVLGILASRVLASIVYEATPRDPLVLTGVVLIMASLGLAATWIPARRALALDPLTLLRDE